MTIYIERLYRDVSRVVWVCLRCKRLIDELKTEPVCWDCHEAVYEEIQYANQQRGVDYFQWLIEEAIKKKDRYAEEQYIAALDAKIRDVGVESVSRCTVNLRQWMEEYTPLLYGDFEEALQKYY